MKNGLECVLGDLAKKALVQELSAQTVAVHSESVYIKMQDGRLLLLCPYKYGRVPFGVAFEHYARLRDMREYKLGEAVLISKGELYFSDGVQVSLQERPTDAETLEYSFLPSVDMIGFCADHLTKNASARGLAPAVYALLCLGIPEQSANVYALRAAAVADDLERALLDKDQALLCAAVGRLVGLGYGLTPSGDDFLCGMLYAFDRMKHIRPNATEHKEMLACAVKEHIMSTNEVSREYLRCACSGVDFEIIDRVISALSTSKDSGAVRERMNALLSVGASSGSDIMCGILFSMYVLECDGK